MIKKVIRPFNAYLFTGAPALLFLTGAPESAGASIFPLILTTFVGSFTAFEVMVTDLLIGPTRVLSYFTLIAELSPGRIGLVSHLGTVQPQDPLHFEIINGSVPELVTVNSQLVSPPF